MQMRKFLPANAYKTACLILLAGCFFAPVAHANIILGGMMYYSALLLLYGNFIIGIFEGVLLRFIFKTPTIKSIAIMIIANYVSAFAGVSAGLPLSISSQAITTDYSSLTNWSVIFISFILTVLIEMFFISYHLPPQPTKTSKTFLITLIIHAFSYAMILAIWFGGLSSDI